MGGPSPSLSRKGRRPTSFIGYGSGSVPKRAPLQLSAINIPAQEATPEQPRPGGPEPVTTIYVRAPWSLGEQLRDLARARSRAEGRRVTVNELAIEALQKLASELAS